MRKILTALSTLLLVTSVRAGTATYNFDTDPSSILKISGNNPSPWRATGGKSGGFLAITYPVGSQSTTVVFPDIDAGKIVTAFTFECDLRVGNSTGDRPADGFSVSFGRAGDPVIESGSGFAGGVPEAGTTTGIAISFDTWAGNALPDGADLEGIIVRYRKVVHERLVSPLGPQRAALQSSVPYHMMAVPKSTAGVKFEEIEQNGGD